MTALTGQSGTSNVGLPAWRAGAPYMVVVPDWSLWSSRPTPRIPGLIADVTGSDYGAAVTRLVLGPLGMTGSSFPAGWPHEAPDAVTGYELEPDGTFVPDLDDLTAILLAAGLWTTAADLVRFGTGWSSLLPAGLASEALRPQDPGHTGLGWRLNLADGIAWEAGDGPGGSASLVVRLSDNHAYVALTNRKVPILGLYRQVFRPGS